MLLAYMVVIVSALVTGLLLKLPLLPEKPRRRSWKISAIFPPVIIALGLYAIFQYFILNHILAALILGVAAAVFSKFILEQLVPPPFRGDLS